MGEAAEGGGCHGEEMEAHFAQPALQCAGTLQDPAMSHKQQRRRFLLAKSVPETFQSPLEALPACPLII